ncbi:tRNA-Thr(GGU) m(6)t(6)A37 methyltransferase TsaA [Acinetobacter marinus]|uniref:tRNA-Thr(GGU) m(6)t(6)A37 methyltransferase TsaA n=2 Tax=Acinetobacter marinus TaxID=281375 RepID=A0A1G6GQ20_9GAMM|nr:tRNA-Thr(GGU) m(6)t(6)A37 methyltransferase TsaA [Acinetobacter marinus]
MRSPYVEKFGIPRQSNLVNTTSYIELIAPYDELNAFQGIAQFSHLWLLWQFHANDMKKSDKAQNISKSFQPMIRPPRLGGNQKIGVFASRSMYRPSQIGLSVVQFLEVKKVDNVLRLYVQGADILDGTPIVDIKPYLAYADAIPDAVSGYAPDAPQILQVVWSEEALIQKKNLINGKNATEQIFQELEQVLAQNPKPAYHDDPDRVYGLSFANLNVKFHIQQQSIMILAVEQC